MGHKWVEQCKRCAVVNIIGTSPMPFQHFHSHQRVLPEAQNVPTEIVFSEECLTYMPGRPGLEELIVPVYLSTSDKKEQECECPEVLASEKGRLSWHLRHCIPEAFRGTWLPVFWW